MKLEILEKIRGELRQRLELMVRAAMAAHAAATDPGSKAEGKYDTRNLEESYLASGQARQVEELAEAVRIFDALVLRDFEMDEPVDAGALVELNSGDEAQFFLLAPASGGLVISHQGLEITLLTPASGLYQKLLGLRVGEAAGALRVMEIL